MVVAVPAVLTEMDLHADVCGEDDLLQEAGLNQLPDFPGAV
jgi:hypothetical protein